ncbi:MAG: hypothetical protein WA021_05145 [Minisyncoccia bacterium]
MSTADHMQNGVEAPPVFVKPNFDTLVELQKREHIYQPKLNLWGTTAGDWQTGVKQSAETFGMPPGAIFDPKLPEGVPYTIENTKNEVAALAHHAWHLMNIEDASTGTISNLESALAAIQAVFGGARTLMMVRPLASEHTDDVRAIRARKLIEIALTRARSFVSPETLNARAVKNGGDADSRMVMEKWLRDVSQEARKSQGSEIRVRSQVRLPEATPLQKRVYFSGSSIPRNASAVKAAIFKELKGVTVVDSHREAGLYGRMEMAEEQRERDKSAVALHVITNDTDSLGAIGQTFWLALLAAFNGQKFGMYIEPTDPTRLSADAVKLRRSLAMHMEAIQRGFSGLITVKESPEALAAWAQQTLEEYKPVE